MSLNQVAQKRKSTLTLVGQHIDMTDPSLLHSDEKRLLHVLRHDSQRTATFVVIDEIDMLTTYDSALNKLSKLFAWCGEMKLGLVGISNRLDLVQGCLPSLPGRLRPERLRFDGYKKEAAGRQLFGWVPKGGGSWPFERGRERGYTHAAGDTRRKSASSFAPHNSRKATASRHTTAHFVGRPPVWHVGDGPRPPADASGAEGLRVRLVFFSILSFSENTMRLLVTRFFP